VLTALSASPSSAADARRYVALGDSYAAGIGIPNDTGPANCDRSDRNYPHLVAQAEGLTNFADASCGGATTAHMTTAQGANPPQFDSLTADTTVVTLQIGGNDIGFADIVGTCATASLTSPFGSPCKDRYTAGGTDALDRRIRDTAPKVAAVIRAVHQRAPSARVLVLGYPSVLPDSGWGCWPAVPVAYGDVPYLRATTRALNSMIAQQAAGNGTTYVDLYGPSVGHDACQWSGRWVEGLNLQTPFHPNAAGHVAMAPLVRAKL
jgi:lysophospholipase L1-like esterase